MSTGNDSSTSAPATRGAHERLTHADLETWLPALMQNCQMRPHRFGVAKLERPVSIELYDRWLAAGHHGEMTYLERHRDLKADPAKWLSFAKSALVFAINYGPSTAREISKSDYVTPGSALRTAFYTKYAPDQTDYHDAIRHELEPVLRELEARFPAAQFRLSIDAEPVLERDLAVRAGLGWVGKNTCVIDRDGGSLFFIAEILTSLETADVGVTGIDFCGTCTRCLDACPTQALVAPRQLDATKCISYWTIESKTVAPFELRTKFGDWFYGCDICQTVCPWNGKVFGRDKMRADSNLIRVPEGDETARENLARDLIHVLESSNRELQRRFEGTPLARARGFGLKRNALVIAANLKLAATLPAIEKLFLDEKLGDLARSSHAEISD